MLLQLGLMFCCIKNGFLILNLLLCSKTYCGYCNRVKQLFTQLGASYKTIELDEGSKGTIS